MRRVVERREALRSRWVDLAFRLRVWGATACVFAVVGCGSEDEPPASKIAVHLEPVQGPGVGARGRAGAWAQRAVEQAVSESDSLTALETPGNGGRFHVAYREIRTAQGAALRLQVEVDVPPQHAARVPNGLEAAVELEREDGTMDLDRDFPVALERAVAVLDAKVALASGREGPILALLEDGDPERVLLALEYVHRRRMRSAAEHVVRLLHHSDLRVARAAVECLGVIGREEHVPRLVAAARLSDRAHTGRLYDALASLGGEQARGFLAFAARNEDDPALAERARRSLERVDVPATPSKPEPPEIARGHR